MPRHIVFAAAVALTATGAVAAEESAPAIRLGAYVLSADGRRVGEVAQIDKAKDGTPQTVEIFQGTRILYVPVATIKVTDARHLTTSLSYAEATRR